MNRSVYIIQVTARFRNCNILPLGKPSRKFFCDGMYSSLVISHVHTSLYSYISIVVSSQFIFMQYKLGYCLGLSIAYKITPIANMLVLIIVLPLEVSTSNIADEMIFNHFDFSPKHEFDRPVAGVPTTPFQKACIGSHIQNKNPWEQRKLYRKA